MNKLLVVYNTCGVGLPQGENLSRYEESLQSILAQQNADFDLVVSACLNTPRAVEYMSKFASVVDIQTLVPVNCSFNYTCRSISREKEYAAYLYVDSGIIMRDSLTLSKLLTRLQDPWVKLVSSRVDDDEGLSNWGLPTPVDEDLEIPLGMAVNAHVLLFSGQLYKAYEQKLWPDIFAGHCSESVLTFLAAACYGRWVIAHDTLCHHKKGIDRQSAGFDTHRWAATGRPTWDHPFKISSVMPRLCNPVSKQLGLGYEEMRGVCMHREDAYDNDGWPKQADELRQYIASNLFLQPQELDYDKEITANVIRSITSKSE